MNLSALRWDLALRTRLIMLVVAAVLPLFGLALVGAVLTANETIRRTSKDLELSVALVSANQERVAESARQLLTAIANTPEVTQAGSGDCRRYFKVLTEKLPLYTNLGVVAADGYVRCDGRSDKAGAFVGDTAYFQAALATRDFVTGDYLLGGLDSKPVIVFALPLLDVKGSVTAVVFAAASLSELSHVISSATLPSGGKLLVTGSTGAVLVTNPSDPASIGRPMADPTLQAAFLAGARGIKEITDASGGQHIYAYRPSANGRGSAFFVAVSADMKNIMAPSRKRLTLVFIALTLVSLLGSFLAWRVGKHAIVIPAKNILKAAGQIQGGQRNVRIETRAGEANSEMTQIAHGFNRMAGALEERERQAATELAFSRTTERKLRDAQRLGRIGNWEFDIKAQRLSWSDEVYALLEVEPGSFDGRHESLLALVHPEDRAVYQQARENAMARNIAFDVEYRLITPKGNERWIHQRGSPVFGDDGQVISRIGVIQEITVRKRAELAVARNIELLNRTGDMAKIGGWELLLDRNVVLCSDQVHRIHDVEAGVAMPLDKLIGLYAPEARPKITAAIRAGIEAGTPWDLVLPLVTAKGRRKQVRVQGVAQRKDGKTQRLVGAMQDVTEQLKAQAHLTLLETALSRVNDIVLITDAEPSEEPGPRIVYVNDAFERRTGYSRQEVIGRSPRFLRGPKTSRAELARIGAAMNKWQPVRAELIHYKKNGEEFWLELDINPIADNKGRFTHFVAVERDITERKLTQQALMDSEHRYTALFATAPVPMWVYDLETLSFLTVNEAAVAQYGFSLEEFLSMTLFDICTEAEREPLMRYLSDTERPEREEWQHQRKDGSVILVKALSRPIKYNSRNACFALALDLTAQIKAEKEVQEYLFTLQRATDAAQAITFHQTLDGTLQEVVEQARGVVGAHQAVVSLSASDGFQAVHAISLSEKYAIYRDRREPVDGVGVRSMVCGNNRTVRMTQAEMEAHPCWTAAETGADARPSMRGCLAVPLIGRNSKNMGLLQLSDRYEGDFTIQDEYVAIEMAQIVSIAIENAQLLEQVNQLNTGLEKKVADRTAALSCQEALFRALAEQAPQVVWTVDTQGGITFINQAWFKLVGGELKDWIGYQWFKAIHPEDIEQVTILWRAAVKSGLPYVGIRRMRARDGSFHTMSCRASPVCDDNGDVIFWVGIDADVSEIKAIETALRLSNQELEAFSYSVSHDLRSPLNTIDGFSRLLAKHLGTTLDDKGKHYLARVQVGVAQMGQLIEDLLSLAQVSRATLRAEQIDLTALAQLIITDRKANSPDRAVSVQIQESLQAIGDGRLLKVVLENLLSNAWKFTARRADATISVGQIDDAAGLPIFFVKDNGAGFDMAYADKLFTAFQRLHTTSEFPGTGIGLATASRVVVRHGGRLWADASPGKGATFFFTVPRPPLLPNSEPA